MSAWFERQKEKDKNFRAQQLDAFEKHRGQLQLEVLEKRSEYRGFPTEKNRKYIETREREIEEMDEFMEARDMDMIRNYKEEINDLCKMLADMSISFAGAAPSSYVKFKNANAKVRRVLIMHGGA